MATVKRSTLCLLGAVGVCLPLAMSTPAYAQVSVGWDAADYDDNGTWEPSTTNIAGSAGMIWGSSSTATLVNGSTNFSSINSYVQTPDFLFTGGNSSDSWNDDLGDAVSDANATWEFIFRPGDYTGSEPIFDTGGTGDGTALRMIDGELNFRYQDSSTAFIELSTDLSTIGDASDFYHVIAVAEVGAANTITQSALYVNGVQVDNLASAPTFAINDWDGGDTAGLGRVGGTSPQGVTYPAAARFDGDLALMNFYSGQLLSTNQARLSYESTTTGAKAATVGWDAAYYDGDGTWEVGTFDTSYANAGSMVFTGTGSVQSGSTNFTGINQWVNAPAMNLSGTGGGSIEVVLGSTFTQQDATVETVFRPGDFNDRHLLFEVGGSGDGMVLQIDGSTLSLIFQQLNAGGTGNVLQYDADLSLIGGADEFFHIVGVMDIGSPNSLSGLYVNGVLIGTAGSTDTVNDWAGGNGGAIGQKNSSTAGGNVAYDVFDGDIATFRLYDEAFTQAEVNTAYSTVPEPTSMVLLGLGGLMLVRRRR